MPLTCSWSWNCPFFAWTPVHVLRFPSQPSSCFHHTGPDSPWGAPHRWRVQAQRLDLPPVDRQQGLSGRGCAPCHGSRRPMSRPAQRMAFKQWYVQALMHPKNLYACSWALPPVHQLCLPLGQSLPDHHVFEGVSKTLPRSHPAMAWHGPPSHACTPMMSRHTANKTDNSCGATGAGGCHRPVHIAPHLEAHTAG